MKRCHIDNWRVKETRCYWQQSGPSLHRALPFPIIDWEFFLSLNCPAYTSLPARINHWLLNEMSIKAEGYYHTGLQASARVMPEAAAQRLKWGEVEPRCRFVCSHRLWSWSSFFFLKDRNRLKFLDFDRHQHVGRENSGAQTHTLTHTHTHTHINKQHPPPVHVYSHAHCCIYTQGLPSDTFTFFPSSLFSFCPFLWLTLSFL